MHPLELVARSNGTMTGWSPIKPALWHLSPLARATLVPSLQARLKPALIILLASLLSGGECCNIFSGFQHDDDYLYNSASRANAAKNNRTWD